MDAITRVPVPVNEPTLHYAPGSPERVELEAELKRQSAEQREYPAVIGGRHRMGGGEPIAVRQPHARAEVLGTLHDATPADAADAIDAALLAAPAWRDLSFDDRAAVLLKAADLLSGPWRARVNAATMLGQSKTAWQAEIDSACELADFWRFNVAFARDILAGQPPVSARGTWNRTDHRPLEGFVLAITPFNFTAIAGNLPTAPALMGNVVVWKPAHAQQHAASLLMALLEEAGLPAGVINMVPGSGAPVSDAALAHRDLAGIHFTGSTRVFQHLWRSVGERIDSYRTYPRLVGETGGKDFVLAHPSADIDVLRVALVRGAFEYQGQKCSAASRAYIPRSLWNRLRDDLVAEVDSLAMGDVRELANFMGAVIDDRSFAKLGDAIGRARTTSGLRVIAGGQADDSVGYFVRPTVVEVDDPTDQMLTTEYFGPLLGVHVFDDDRFAEVMSQMESVAPYALTGSIIAADREAVARATHALRFAAGNFYVNDKPTGAVVGQQPFGGARASGTNDKAGSPANLMRWVSPRTIKETFDAPRQSGYPHMG